MNSGHDLGGMMGFGPIDTNPLDPNFHDHWEERMFALTVAMGATGRWNIDISRHARESIHPGLYMTLSYYQIWLAGLEKLMLDASLVSQQELDEGHALQPAKQVAGILHAENVMKAMMAGSPYERKTTTTNRFDVGDKIIAKNMHPRGHTRIPRYARGKSGVIDRVHGCHVFPDSNAHGKGEDPQWLYKVRFSAREIWGDDHPGSDCIFVDLWEPYLDQQ